MGSNMFQWHTLLKGPRSTCPSEGVRDFGRSSVTEMLFKCLRATESVKGTYLVHRRIMESGALQGH